MKEDSTNGPGLTAAEFAVRQATTFELAIALTQGHPFAADVGPDPLRNTIGYVRCPRCQRRPSTRRVDCRRLGEGPAGAVAPDGMTIHCLRCSRTTTRWHLERLVLETVDALEQLLPGPAAA